MTALSNPWINLLVVVSGFSVLAVSCSFNGQFLQPTAIHQTVKRFRLTINSDTIWIAASDSTSVQEIEIRVDSSTLKFSLENVWFSNVRGNRLYGWILSPEDSSGITLLHYHGNAGFILSQFGAIIPMLRYGFQLFVFDYSGFGISGGRATRKNAILDSRAALDFIKNREDFKDSKIVLYGQSLGGNLAAVTAVADQDAVDGLVLEGAFSSHRDIATKHAGILGRILVREGISTVDAVSGFRKHLLVVHSSEDDLIPISMGRKIFEQANEPKEFFPIKHEHMGGPFYYGDSLSLKIKNWFGND